MLGEFCYCSLHFCPALPAAFAQPGNHLSAEPCSTELEILKSMYLARTSRTVKPRAGKTFHSQAGNITSNYLEAGHFFQPLYERTVTSEMIGGQNQGWLISKESTFSACITLLITGDLSRPLRLLRRSAHLPSTP